MMRKKKKLAILVGILSVTLLGVGITYSLFSYVKEGSTINSIEQGHLTFIYEEIDKQGNGISIYEALPISDAEGRQGQAFNFQVLSKKSFDANLPYEITLRQTEQSDDIGEIIKIYLTKVDDSNNEEVVKEVKYSELPTITRNGYTEKQVYRTEVPSDTKDYNQKYRLRMWVDGEADFSNGYSNKTFGITVNVYANDAGIEEAPVPSDDIRIDRIIASSTTENVAPTTSVLTESSKENVDFETTLPNNIDEISIDVLTLNSGASSEVTEIVGITPLKGLLESYSIKKLENDGENSEINEITKYPLKTGDNYFKVTVRSANKAKTKDYVIDIYREKNSNTNLSVFTINGQTIQPDTTTVEVPYETTSLDIVAQPEVNTTTVSIKGKTTNIDLGINPIKIKIKAEDETEKEISIDVVRKQSSDASINNVGVKGYTLTKVEGNIYSVEVANEIEKVEIENVSTKEATVIGIGEKELNYGINDYTITVVSQDGTNRIDYTIRVNRLIDTNSKLSNLTVSGCSLTFDPSTTEYSCNVDNSVESVTVSGEKESELATVTGFDTYNLNVDTNTINVVVTAQDGVTQTTYTITVNRARNTDATLKNITLSSGTLSPAFDKNTTAYTVTVPYSVDNIDVTGEATKITSNVSGNGNKILNVGNSNVVTLTVTAEDGITEMSYTITITREQDTDTSLKSLSVTGYSVVKVDDTHYTLTVENDVTEIEINAEANSAVAQVALSGGTGVGALAALTTGTRTLTVGNNIFVITVTAQNGDSQTYQLTVTRKASSDATLKALSLSSGTLSPAFDKDTTSYTASVPYSIESITTEATKNNSEATVTVTGGEELVVGTNTITVLVTAGNGNEKTYTITVTREQDTDNTLKTLTVSGCSLTFDSNTTEYSCQVENSVSSTTVAATANSSVATIEGTGSYTLTSKSTKNISVVVTAQNGTKKTYTVSVYRKPSTDATLKSLTISPGTLSPTFAKATTAYTVSVDYNVTSMTVTPTVNNSEASAVVENNTNFGYGTNTISIVVTAGDGTTKETYTITVTRNKLTASQLTFTSATNPDTSTKYTTCTNVKCALDELYDLTK